MSKKVLEVYLLIDSLEKTEKAYFSKFGFKYKKKGNPIFELYCLIEKKLKRKKIKIDSKFEENIKNVFLMSFPNISFSSVKLRLLNDLLDALVNYHHSENNENKLLFVLQKVEILISKGFLDYATKQLKINLKNPLLETNEELQALFYSKFIHSLYKNYDVENIIAIKEAYFKLIERMYHKTSLSILYDNVFMIHIRYANINK